MTAEMIVKEAMALPPEKRLEIAETLWESLDGGKNFVVDSELAEELDRRFQEMESGEVEGVPSDVVRAQLWRRNRSQCD